MAHIYEASVTQTLSASTHIATLLAGSGSRAEIREIGVFSATSTAVEVLITRPGTPGVTPSATGACLGQALDTNDVAATGELYITFTGTTPVAGANPFRRVELSANAGAGVIFVWGPGEFLVATSAQVSIHAGASSSNVMKVYMKWVE